MWSRAAGGARRLWAEGWRGGCLQEQMEWLELQVGSEDGWTAPPGLESVSAGDTPVLWGRFCSAGSLSVQRAWVPLGTASPVTGLRGWCVRLPLWSPGPPLASVGPLLEGHRTTHLSLDPVLGAGAESQLLQGPRPRSSEMSLGAGIVQELVKITDSRTGHPGPRSERLRVTPESWHFPLAVLWLSQLGISCPPGCAASVLSPVLEKLKMLSVPGAEGFTLHGSTPKGHLGSPLVAWQLASASLGTEGLEASGDP